MVGRGRRKGVNREGRDRFMKKGVFINCVFKRFLTLNQITSSAGIGGEGLVGKKGKEIWNNEGSEGLIYKGREIFKVF